MTSTASFKNTSRKISLTLYSSTLLKSLAFVTMNPKYAGMTVNERLYISGLLDDFDKAVKTRNSDAVCAILKKVELTDESIIPILDSLGLR